MEKKPRTKITAQLLNEDGTPGEEHIRIDLMTGEIQPAKGPKEEYPSEAVPRPGGSFAALDDGPGGPPYGWIQAKGRDPETGRYIGEFDFLITVKSVKAIQKAEAALRCKRCGAERGEIAAYERKDS